MKVLFCTPYGDITKDNIGGISVWAKAIVAHYQSVDSDIDLEVFALDRKTYVRGVNMLVRLWTGIVEYVQLVRKVRKQIDAGAYDAIHLCTTASLSLIKDWLILGYAHRKGLKTFLHFHNGRVREIVSRKNWESRLLRRVLRVVDVPIVMDAFSFDALGEWHIATAVNLPNPLSSFVSQAIASCHPLPERVKGRLLFVGHIVDIKGVYELVEACARMSDVRLRMVGYAEDDVRQRLLAMASQRQGDWLEMTGGLSREDTIQEILLADVLIAPQYEIKIKGFTIEVNVSGYPAKYKNIRSVSIDGNVNNNPLKLEVNQPLEISSIEANKPAILDDELEILETNAKNGNVEDQFTLGMTYLDTNKTDLAVSWLKKAAQAKHMEAQYELGSWYLREGFPYPAKKWLKKAADQGHKEAKELLKNL